MDYKNRERRASSATTETIKSLKNGKYQLYDEYKARLSKTPMKSKIEADFGPFYKWVINGRTDDLKKEIIEKLLFKTN
ncbi:Protein CBG14187 [Caenorhabditis briggsae]|uniref:Protein CBG14187 n=1 Tax=Caenorhabditis briggsae TaxID=6238 RepID=A8XJG9_CAEBR|nr:Protein CBG14187 [Caenorhabditis briggsae]CAP32794.2 Protein CBG14187 [Caenorhabditis briggsae]